MSGEQLSRVSTATEDPSDMVQMYQPFIMMEDLMDKLKVLNHEEEFIKALKMRPMNK